MDLQNEDNEKSEENDRYDWLRITMVSHNGEEFTFGNGDGNQTQLVKLNFKIEDVVDDFSTNLLEYLHYMRVVRDTTLM